MSRRTKEELLKAGFWIGLVLVISLVIKIMCLVKSEPMSETVMASELPVKMESVLVGAPLEEDLVEIELESETEELCKAFTEHETESEVASETEIISETEFESESRLETERETESFLESESEMQISDYSYDKGQAIALAQLMWAEARGCSEREQSLVAWTVLNRVDVKYDGMTDFWSILTEPDQFAYNYNNPFLQYEYDIAVDVLQRWAAEKDGVVDSGRTLPKGYLYYYGDGKHNYFSTDGQSDELWFGLGDPYEGWANVA